MKPGANLFGVPTGEVSGFFAVDIDPRNGGDVWERENKHLLARARVHETMSGGRHYLFNQISGLNSFPGTQKSGVAPGVDIKAGGGWIVWWPAAGLPVS